MRALAGEVKEMRKRRSGVANGARKRYNVLFIAPTSFFADYGCHVRILEEALVLRKRGHRVTIVTYYNGRDIADLGIERTLPIPWRQHYEVGSSRHKIAFDALLSLKSLTVGLRVRPDVIHAHLHEGGLIGYFLSRLLRVPLVFDFQGSLTSEMIDHRFLKPNGLVYHFLRWLEEKIDHVPDAIFTSSRYATDFLRDEFHCSPAKIHPLPDCVNSDTFRPGVLTPEEREALRTRWNIRPGVKVVAYLGLLADYQGTRLLVDAIRKLVRDEGRRDSHFLIMGYPGVQGYQAYAQELGLSDYVTFTGRVPYEEAPRMLALGNVAVAPKISATEGSGKILNYMAMGLPTVAFDTPVHREYLGELGIYAERGRADALAEALGWLLDREAHRREVGAQLRARALKLYSWDRAGQRIEEVYDHVCSSRQAML
jgi:glycosyltransferase involved in cell wall biosynthesis